MNDEANPKRMSSMRQQASGTSRSRMVVRSLPDDGGTRTGAPSRCSAAMHAPKLRLSHGAALAVDRQTLVALELLDRGAELRTRGVGGRARPVAEIVEARLLAQDGALGRQRGNREGNRDAVERRAGAVEHHLARADARRDLQLQPPASVGGELRAGDAERYGARR